MAYAHELYMHDLDKRAFDALSTFPKLVRLKEAYIEHYDEKAAKFNFLSSAIRLSENQMPEIYNLLPPICDKLEIEVPELYYVKSKEINAATGGSTNPYVYVTSKMVEKVPTNLIASVLAHECGHIACKHYLYHSIAMQLLEGIDNSPLRMIPGIGRILTPTLFRALMFWYRCSELSADRAAVLCDGNAENTVDMLLKVHGYDDNINRDEFLRQALDLRDFVNESNANKAIEAMIVQGNSHPRMATRAYECYSWARSEQYRGIVNGTYTLTMRENEDEKAGESEVVSAEMDVDSGTDSEQTVAVQDDINERLAAVNRELERYTNYADKGDYAFAIASGLIAGMIDAMFIGKISITGEDIGLSHKQVNNFIQEYARSRGFDNKRLKDAIIDLEDAFKVAQDNVWKGTIPGVTPANHHLADLAHHPTPLGLASAIVVQFLRVGTFVNKDGEWHFKLVKTRPSDLVEIMVPAVITGILNWLACAAKKKYEEASGKELPEFVNKLIHIAASTPIIIEIAKCADNWFGHMVSDMGGSRSTAGGGMGIPGIFVSLLHEISALPGLKNTGLPAAIDNMYVKGKLDLRHELAYYKQLGKQTIPVIFNDVYLRLGYFLTHLVQELAERNEEKGIDWNRVIPFNNRTVDRMLMVSSMTFNLADTADAAVHAALESGGNWVLFAGNFVSRFNYVGAGRAALSIVKEISNEKKEAQLIHERMILMEVQTKQFVESFFAYKQQVEEKLANYLAEDIQVFLEGMDYMKLGLQQNNSGLVIRGNVMIQRVLGREPQFTTQSEFDDLMESDVALQL